MLHLQQALLLFVSMSAADSVTLGSDRRTEPLLAAHLSWLGKLACGLPYKSAAVRRPMALPTAAGVPMPSSAAAAYAP